MKKYIIVVVGMSICLILTSVYVQKIKFHYLDKLKEEHAQIIKLLKHTDYLAQDNNEYLKEQNAIIKENNEMLKKIINIATAPAKDFQ